MTDSKTRPNSLARQMVQIRMRTTAVDRLDAMATELGVTRSDVIREALAIALADPAKVLDRIERKKQSL